MDYSKMSEDELRKLALESEDAAWELYSREKEAEVQAWRSEDDYDPEADICGCFHSAARHYMEDGYCLSPKCDCQHFGDYEEPEPIQVWFTEAPGGHNGWE